MDINAFKKWNSAGGGFNSLPSGSTRGGYTSDLMSGQSPVLGGTNIADTDPGASFVDGMTGYTDADGIKHGGWGGMALGGATSLFNGWLGMKKLGMAKDQLRENKRQFNMNWGAQKKTTNAQLADRQRRRVSAGGGAQPVDEYMSKWGIE